MISQLANSLYMDIYNWLNFPKGKANIFHRYHKLSNSLNIIKIKFHKKWQKTFVYFIGISICKIFIFECIINVEKGKAKKEQSFRMLISKQTFRWDIWNVCELYVTEGKNSVKRPQWLHTQSVRKQEYGCCSFLYKKNIYKSRRVYSTTTTTAVSITYILKKNCIYLWVI